MTDEEENPLARWVGRFKLTPKGEAVLADSGAPCLVCGADGADLTPECIQFDDDELDAWWGTDD